MYKVKKAIKEYKNKENPSLKDFSTLFTIMLRAISTFDQLVADNASKEATEELIFLQLRNETLNDKFKDKAKNIEALKRFADSVSITYCDTISLKELKKDVSTYLSRKKFNVLTSSKSNSVRKLKNYCITHSIPYQEKHLKT